MASDTLEALRFNQEVIFERGVVMEDEQKPLGIFSIVIIIFLAAVVFGVMAGTFFGF